MYNLYHEVISSEKPQMAMSNVLLKRERGVKCQCYKRQREAAEIFQVKGAMTIKCSIWLESTELEGGKQCKGLY